MSAAGKWVIGFLGACTILIGVLLLAIWAWNGFGTLDISFAGAIALILAVVLTAGLSAGLAAAMLYSARSGVDSQVYYTNEEGLHAPPPPKEPDNKPKT